MSGVNRVGLVLLKVKGVVVPQWYTGNPDPTCTFVMQKGSLSPRVLPNGTQAISIETCIGLRLPGYHLGVP